MKYTNTWSCETCKKTFVRKGDLGRHEQLHRGYKPHVCEHCGKAFSQFSGLKTHWNVHTRMKPFVCDIDGCKSAFGDPSSCSRHRKETHRTLGAYRCPYPQCSSNIKRRSAFISHLKKHDIDPESIDIDSLAPAVDPSAIVGVRVKSETEGTCLAELIPDKPFDDMPLYTTPLLPFAADSTTFYDNCYFPNPYTTPEPFIPDLLTMPSPPSSSSGSVTPSWELSPCPSPPPANQVTPSCAGAAFVDMYAPADPRFLSTQFQGYPGVGMQEFWNPECFNVQALNMD
ncbi:hypothetical protein BD779DRAFT_1492612 [Infundibulicybe gibba]|nr:hypothetical protein BD779DRAFT_1492612 [Infundibulicybe gibba]